MTGAASSVKELPEAHDIDVRGVAFSPDGHLLAGKSGGQVINIWDWKEGRVVKSLSLAQGASMDLSTEKFQFSPDGHLFATCHSRAAGDVVMRVWETDSWTIAHDVLDPVGGSGCDAIAFAPNGKTLFRLLDRLQSISGDTLIAYDTSTWEKLWGIRTIPFHANSLAISPDGKAIALGGEVINPKSLPNALAPTAPMNPPSMFEDPSFPNAGLIAILDLETKKFTKMIRNSGVMDNSSRLAWSPDGAHLCAAGGEGLQLFDVNTGAAVVDVKPPKNTALTSLRYTPNGKYLIEGVTRSMTPSTGWGKIWDSRHQSLLQEISGNVSSIAVSSDSRYMAIGTDGKTTIYKFKE